MTKFSDERNGLSDGKKTGSRGLARSQIHSSPSSSPEASKSESGLNSKPRTLLNYRAYMLLKPCNKSIILIFYTAKRMSPWGFQTPMLPSASPPETRPSENSSEEGRGRPQERRLKRSALGARGRDGELGGVGPEVELEDLEAGGGTEGQVHHAGHRPGGEVRRVRGERHRR